MHIEVRIIIGGKKKGEKWLSKKMGVTLHKRKRAAVFSVPVNKRRVSLWETSWMHSVCTGTNINQGVTVLSLLA